MKAPWFLPMAMVVGVLCSRTSVEFFKGLHGRARAKEGIFFLVMGWIPTLAWTLAQFVQQS
jgi:hypothetical protein